MHTDNQVVVYVSHLSLGALAQQLVKMGPVNGLGSSTRLLTAFVCGARWLP